MLKEYPDWVLAHKKKNVEIRKIKNNFYAYKIKSVWNKKTKRVQKITEKYLGRITEDKIIPPKHQREQNVNAILEFGNAKLVHHFAPRLAELLQKQFPHTYDLIIAAAMIKLLYKPALKNFAFHYQTSYVKEFYPEAMLSAKKIAEILNMIGVDYGSLLDFFKQLTKGEQHLAIDLTTVFTDSDNITWAEKGYNKDHISKNQIQILLMYSLDEHVPSFFKLLPGNVADVTTLTNSLDESDIKDITLVADRGFYAQYNIASLDAKNIKYIIPVKRGMLKFLQYPNDEKYTNYFSFRKRHIWYFEYTHNNKRVVQFLDKKLRQEEETAFLNYVDKKKKTIEEYHKRKTQFGVITMITNTDLSCEEAYQLYKKRIEIEVTFDALKNTLESDKTYMRSNETTRGYFFLTFLALHLYSQIINHLKKHDLLNKYSVHDVLLQLSKIYKIRLNNKEITSEIPKKTRTLLDQLKLPIT